MWTPEKITQRITHIGFKPRNTKQEIKSLHTVLDGDEELIYIIEGILQDVRKKNVPGQLGTVSVTNKRILFYRKSIIGTVTQEDFPLSKVSSVAFRKGILSASVSIFTSNNDATIEHVHDKKGAELFVNEVKKLINAPSATPAQSLPQPTSNMDQLKTLFELKQLGAITEAEFEDQKRKLLA